ncbi:MAG: ABC transporter ATP-binding protein [Actinobacteria bacterium]|nr:ABC transporter ATP-binding protein [Actinomycetota bacterium]
MVRSANGSAADSTRPRVQLKDATVRFKTQSGEITALHEVNLEILENEFICLMGPSGCGKTTALNVIAGFQALTSGQALLDGNPIEGADASRAVVFQSDAVFPWMTVAQNVAFGPTSQNRPKQEIDRLVKEFLSLTDMQGFADSWPMQLSGGMRKRVDIARAYASQPEVLLMDEPFGNLDFILKETLQGSLRDLWANVGGTIVFVTHDIEEAIFLGDRIVVMTPRPGKIAKIIPIDFGKVRADDIRTSPEFIAIRRGIRELMTETGALA